MNRGLEFPTAPVENVPAASVSNPAKRILVIAGCFPYPPTNGLEMRIWAMLRSLASSGHSVDLLCFGDPDRYQDAPEIHSVCRSVEVIPHVTSGVSRALDIPGRLRVLCSAWPYPVARSRSKEMEESIRSRLEAQLCDAVLFEETYLLVNFPGRTSVPVAIDHHNSEYTLVRRYLAQERNPIRLIYGWLEAMKLRAWERNVSRRADLILTCSDADRQIFKNLAPEVPAVVVPNVIDVDQYVPVQRDVSTTILYTGGMDWYPNQDAVRYFVREMMPIVRKAVSGVRFVIAGRNPPEAFRKSLADVLDVEFTGAVPNIREEIAKAAVCVVPLRMGSGTRLKILEAAAMGKPVVSTTIGAEGLEFKNGKEIMLADDPKLFGERVIKLLNDKSERERIGSAARERVRSNYSLDVLRCRLADVSSALVAENRTN
jgi:glycosyltransferase involved in cell wall biosynthesis